MVNDLCTFKMCGLLFENVLDLLGLCVCVCICVYGCDLCDGIQVIVNEC